MGCYQIWWIEWKDKKSKKHFEKLKLHQRILCSYSSFSKDILINKQGNETTYFMGWDGYALGEEFLNKHLNKLNIKRFYSLDLSCRGSWYNELKEFNDRHKTYNDRHKKKRRFKK